MHALQSSVHWPHCIRSSILTSIRSGKWSVSCPVCLRGLGGGGEGVNGNTYPKITDVALADLNTLYLEVTGEQTQPSVCIVCILTVAVKSWKLPRGTTQSLLSQQCTCTGCIYEYSGSLHITRIRLTVRDGSPCSNFFFGISLATTVDIEKNG